MPWLGSMTRLYNTPGHRSGKLGLMSDQTYKGSCHCGAVQYEVTMPPPQKAFACNCSICSRTGSLMAFVKEGAFRQLGRTNATTDYQFAKKNIHHEFCSTCGVRPYARGRGKD